MGFYILYTTLPAVAATVTIIPIDQLLDQNYTFTTSTQPNLASHQVSGRTLTYMTSTKTQTVPVHYTGHIAAIAASGLIVFSQLRVPVDLYEARPLLVDDGNISVELEPKTITLQPGSTYTFTAHSLPAGASGDLPANAIDGGYAVGSFYALRLKDQYIPYAYLSNPEPFTGGRDAYDGPIVNPVDTQPVENDLTAQLHQEVSQAFQSQLNPGEALLNNLECIPNIQEQPPIGSPATSVTITASLNCTIGTYDATAVHTQIESEMNQLARISFDSHLKMWEPLQLSLGDSDVPNGFSIRASGHWRLLLDRGGKRAVQEALAGLSQDDARKNLQVRYAADTVSLDLSWWWGEQLPLDPLAIEIVARFSRSS